MVLKLHKEKCQPKALRKLAAAFRGGDAADHNPTIIPSPLLPPELWLAIITFFKRADWLVPTTPDGVLVR